MASTVNSVVGNPRGTTITTVNTAAENGTGFFVGELRGKSVQRVAGTGTYSVEASNDNATWGPLGTAISAKNDAGVYGIVEHARYLRIVTATAGATVVVFGLED